MTDNDKTIDERVDEYTSNADAAALQEIANTIGGWHAVDAYHRAGLYAACNAYCLAYESRVMGTPDANKYLDAHSRLIKKAEPVISIDKRMENIEELYGITHSRIQKLVEHWQTVDKRVEQAEQTTQAVIGRIDGLVKTRDEMYQSLRGWVGELHDAIVSGDTSKIQPRSAIARGVDNLISGVSSAYIAAHQKRRYDAGEDVGTITKEVANETIPDPRYWPIPVRASRLDVARGLVAALDAGKSIPNGLATHHLERAIEDQAPGDEQLDAMLVKIHERFQRGRNWVIRPETVWHTSLRYALERIDGDATITTEPVATGISDESLSVARNVLGSINRGHLLNRSSLHYGSLYKLRETLSEAVVVTGIDRTLLDMCERVDRGFTLDKTHPLVITMRQQLVAHNESRAFDRHHASPEDARTITENAVHESFETVNELVRAAESALILLSDRAHRSEFKALEAAVKPFRAS